MVPYSLQPPIISLKMKGILIIDMLYGSLPLTKNIMKLLLSSHNVTNLFFKFVIELGLLLSNSLVIDQYTRTYLLLFPFQKH